MVIYQKITGTQNNKQRDIWVAYEENAPYIRGIGNTCDEALENLSIQLDAIMKTIARIREENIDCE